MQTVWATLKTLPGCSAGWAALPESSLPPEPAASGASAVVPALLVFVVRSSLVPVRSRSVVPVVVASVVPVVVPLFVVNSGRAGAGGAVVAALVTAAGAERQRGGQRVPRRASSPESAHGGPG